MKNVIKISIFLLILIIIFMFVSKILWLKKTPTSYFFEEPKNSFDVVYVGASNANYHFNSVLSYDLYGYTTGMLCSDAMPFFAIKYLIAESLKHNHLNYMLLI